ncbi:MAG: N,N-dimethylformamidase beta subunit family domain-containing protein [Acidimicrobiales bacterium]
MVTGETGAVEGYANRTSAMPGESIGLCCAGRGRFSIEVARLGATRDVVWRQNDIEASDHPIPDDAAQNGCGWPVSVEVPVGDDWRSGCYEVDLIPSDGSPPRQACFAVRAALGRRAPYLLVMATATAAAYNDWGGLNLYTGAVESSLRRPWGNGFVRRPDDAYLRHAHTIDPGRGTIEDVDVNGTRRLIDIEAHDLSPWVAEAGWSNWEGPFFRWAESQGYAVDVATSADLHADPLCLAQYKAMLSVGHDEYWSWQMRDAVEEFVQAGGNVAFFSGNNVCWQVRFDPDMARMTSYKFMGPYSDPVVGTPDERRMTGLWSDPMIDRPENQLTGVSFTRGGYVRFGYGVPRGSGGYTVWRPDHWVFEGTGLRYGDQLGTDQVVVGYEADGCALTLENNLPVPTGEDATPRDMVILATSPAHLWSGFAATPEMPPRQRPSETMPADIEYMAMRLFGDWSPANVAKLAAGNAVMGVFTQPGGGTTFTCGCTDWARGLGPDPNPDVARITANVLDRLGRVAV